MEPYLSTKHFSENCKLKNERSAHCIYSRRIMQGRKSNVTCDIRSEGAKKIDQFTNERRACSQVSYNAIQASLRRSIFHD